MKKLSIFTSFVILAAAVSCTVKEQDEVMPVPSHDEEFYATIEQPSDADTKTYADGQFRVLWHSDDRITIFNRYTYNQEYAFQGETGDNAGAFYKVGDSEFVTGNDLPDIYAVYPYQKGTKISNDGVITVMLPGEQGWVEGSFGAGSNTMVSATSDNKLKFKNVGGILAFKLYGNNVQVSKITILGNNDESIAGRASIYMPVGGTPSVTMQSDAAAQITLNCNAPVSIGATADDYTEFWFVVPPTTFTGGFTIVVTGSDGGTFEKKTVKSISVERNHISRMAPVEVVLKKPAAEPEWVDLGLSVKWATSNVGANAPEEYGDYFAWGETEPKVEYKWQNYQWGWGDNAGYRNSICKYNIDGWLGTVDETITLKLEDDAANLAMGGLWRMPTYEELMELREKCDWRWTTINGVDGYEVIGQNNNSIFLPAAGRWHNTGLNNQGSVGEYWSSSIRIDFPPYAWSLDFNSSSVFNRNAKRYRSNGCTIRPVLGENVIGIKLSENELSLYEGGIAHLTATTLPAGSYSAISWSSSNPSVATVNALGDVRCISSGNATISASIPNLGYVASCEVHVSQLETYNTDLIDLGLSVQWAACNLGANTPEQSGFYYSYGETDSKYEYSWNTHIWYDFSNSTSSLIKYNSEPTLGVVDNKTVLDDEDDVVNVKLGGNWRSPTYEELKELRDYCSWVQTTINGVNGYLVTSMKYGFTNHSIFLPVTGYCYGVGLLNTENEGHYYSSSLASGDSRLAYHLICSPSMAGGEGLFYRYNGLAVRPVYDDGIRRNVTSISLDYHSLALNEGERAVLTATILPAVANDKRIEWTSSDDAVATISSDGVVKAVHKGRAEITATTVEGGYSDKCIVEVNHIVSYSTEYVDLGLSVKWATCNLGAASPERYGNYYAWGEIETKSNYSWSSYKWCNGSKTTLTKYNNYVDYGVVDNKAVLEESDDVAHIELGETWHIPTFVEMNELIESCSWTLSALNDVTGYVVTGPSGRSIFLPCIDYFTNYWTSSLSFAVNASSLVLTSSNYWPTTNERCYGFQIRPVRE